MPVRRLVHWPASAPLARLVPVACSLVSLSCGPTPRRDLSAIPQRRVTYENLCGLQDYFDQRAAGHARPLRIVNEQSTETTAEEVDESGRREHLLVGEGTYVVSHASARHELGALLERQYARLPNPLAALDADIVNVRVAWWGSGTMRRLRPDRPIEITSTTGRLTLPFDPCVGEFLFGEEIYAMRRAMLRHDEHGVSRGAILPAAPRAAQPGDAGFDATVDAAAP